MAAYGYHWYSVIGAYKVSNNTQRQLAVFVFAWVLVSAGISFHNTLKQHNNVFSQLHSTPDNSKSAWESLHEAHPGNAHMDVPSQYLTMDWVMSPMHTKHTTPYSSIPVGQHMCMDGRSSCSPALWHTSLACNTSYSTPRISPIIKDVQPYIYKNSRTKWRHISPTFTCLSEKIGLYTLWLNNEHSWSISSTHNVNFLITTVFVLLGIVAISIMIGAMTSSSGGYGHQYNQMVLAAFVAIYLVASYFWASSVALDSDKNLHRPIGTASYFYSAVAIVSAALIFNSTSVHEDNESGRVSVKDETSTPEERKGMRQEQHNASNENGMNWQSQEMKSMNVGGFIKEQTRIGARIKVPAVNDSTAQVGFEHVCSCMNRPVHSKFVYAQLLTLPLILLALCIHGRNYGVDTQTQVVFVTSLAVVLIDCFLYRLWWAFNIHKSVQNRSDEDTEYHCMQLVTLLCTLFQVMVYVYYIVSDVFAETYQWVFISYIVITSLAKLAAVQGIHDNRFGGRYYQEDKHKTSFASSTALLLTSDVYLFVLYVVAVSVVSWIYVIQDNLQFKPIWIEKDSLDMQWGPGWQTFQTFAVSV